MQESKEKSQFKNYIEVTATTWTCNAKTRLAINMIKSRIIIELVNRKYLYNEEKENINEFHYPILWGAIPE